MLVPQADGRWLYSPSVNFHGSDRFTFQLSDGQLVSNRARFKLTVTSVNDAPGLLGQSLVLDEDGTFTSPYWVE